VRDTLDAERVRSPHLIRCYWQITREIFDAIEAVI
jgi:hypothetical protein